MNGEDVIAEGAARILLSWRGQSVFYNPVGSFTRTLGVLVLAAEAELKGRSLAIADVMCASGVRGIRYFLESGAVDSVHFNDVSAGAAKVCRKNVEINQMENFSEISQERANAFLGRFYSDGTRYDMVDIDPYGSFARYIDNAVAAVKSGGVLAATATDLAPLCRRGRRSAFRKYGSYSLDVDFCHELAARILVKSVVEACGRKDLVATPLLTVYSDHYVRTYARIVKGRERFPHRRIHFLHVCPRCRNIWTLGVNETPPGSTSCTCSSPSLVAGPLWIGLLHSDEFLEKMKGQLGLLEVSSLRRVSRYLSCFTAENHLPPYFFDVHKTADRLDRVTPSIDSVINSLRSKGFYASRTHFNPTGVKTSAPYEEFAETLRTPNPSQIA